MQGFTDEVLDLDHETYARECAIDIPGPETDYLGRLAQQWGAYVVAQAKARHPEFPGRFFNVGFVIEPEDGTVILRHHKLVPLLPVEHSVTPHNVWDRWIELYGRELDAFYPVADTEIGRIGIMMANEASYPENARGLAMNGCEIAYRGPYPAPGVMSGMFSVQNRARALDNNMYVIGMNLGTYYLDKDSTTPIDTFSGGSQIVDYRGQVVTEVPYGAGSTWIAGTIDIEALRNFRQTAQWDNWMKDLTTEQYQLDLRAADLPEEPVPRARAVHACRIPRGGDPQAGGVAPGARGVGASGAPGAEFARSRRGVHVRSRRGVHVRSRRTTPRVDRRLNSGRLGRRAAHRAGAARDERAALARQRGMASARQAVRVGAPAAPADLRALGDAAPAGPILGARVEHVGAKEALLADDPGVYFTTPHFDGYPAILVRLDEIGVRELEEVIVEAWLVQAPKRLARE